MSEADPVVQALEAALAEGEDPDLRLAIAHHLLVKGDPVLALEHAQVALGQRPTDIEVLQVTSEAAQMAGRHEVADGYRRLLAALGQAGEPPPGVPEVQASPDAAAGEPPSRIRSGAPADGAADEFDAFLMEVLAEDEEQRVRLDDVGGMERVKEELERRFFLPIRNPDLQKAYGKPLTGGLLLYGPPGCGKTFLARAIAGELAARFVPVTLHDTLDMWMGQSEQNLHAIFEQARSSTPTVLFLDEVDAIGQRRSRSANSAMRGVVAQLLNELDGAVERNDGVFVIAATNAPWDVDPALRRPGRFDRTVLVLPPDEEARKSILEVHLRNRPTAANLDLAKLARKTKNLSGADLQLICDTAVELAMTAASRSGNVVPVDQKLLEQAAKKVKPSIGPWLETARNFVTFSNNDGEYDELDLFLKSQRR